MRDRKEIENGISWNRSGGPYADNTNLAVNLNLESVMLESVMGNLGLVIEVLLDIRDIFKEQGDKFIGEAKP